MLGNADARRRMQNKGKTRFDHRVEARRHESGTMRMHNTDTDRSDTGTCGLKQAKVQYRAFNHHLLCS